MGGRLFCDLGQVCLERVSTSSAVLYRAVNLQAAVASIDVALEFAGRQRSHEMIASINNGRPDAGYIVHACLLVIIAQGWQIYLSR